MILALKNNAWFQSVSKETLQELLAAREIIAQSYPRGRTMHAKGAVCHGMHLLYSGEVVTYSLAANGSETVVFAFEPGDAIGANFLFGKQEQYPMNVFCQSDCRTLFLSRAAVLRLLHNYDFTIAFVQAISRNAQRMNQKIAIYTRGSLRKNLLDYLRALAAEQDTLTVVLPMSKKQMADYFGVQRPSLFRELKRMKEEGLIAVENRQITLL